MRLDPRHFNRFMVITAACSMITIAFFTIRHQRLKQLSFEQDIRSTLPHWWAQAGPEDLPHLFTPSTTEQGIPRSEPFPGDLMPDSAGVVIVFWAPWSERSMEVLNSIDQVLDSWPSDTLRVPRLVALGVKESPDAMRKVAASTGIDASWLDGTKAYADLKVPGVPTMIVFNRSGDVSIVDIGVDPLDIPDILTRSHF